MKQYVMKQLRSWLIRPGLEGIEPDTLCALKHELQSWDARSKKWKTEAIGENGDERRAG